MVAPVKLAHIALKTNDLSISRNWFLTVLDARVVFENEMLCFMTYDSEHHRVVLALDPEYKPDEKTNGIHHLSFTYESIADLFDTYERLKTEGITPHWCINHGPTLSMYFHDPMNNQIELQIDTMSAELAMAFVESDVFRKNPIGITFDPDELVQRHKAGEEPSSLWAYNP